jgi:hypothetical protein
LPSDLAHAKRRYEQAAAEARRLTAVELCPKIGVDFHLTGWTNKGRDALQVQWTQRHSEAGWDWPEIFRRHRDPDRLELVIWGPKDRLCGLALCLTTGHCVEIRFLEGDAKPDCPLKGRRILIVLDCAARYAQARGKEELRAQPVNPALQALYRDVYGFALVAGKSAGAYWFRKV